MSLDLLSQIILKGPSIATRVVEAANALSAQSTETTELTDPPVEVKVEEPKDSFTNSTKTETVSEQKTTTATPTISDVLKATTGFSIDDVAKGAAALLGTNKETTEIDKAESKEGIATPSSMARNDVKSNIEAGIKTATNWLAQGMAWGAKAVVSPMTAFTELVTHPSVTKVFSNFSETISGINNYFFKPIYNFFSNTYRYLFGSSSSCKAKKEAYLAKLEEKRYIEKMYQEKVYQQKQYEKHRNEIAASEEKAYEEQAAERRQIALAEAQKRSSETPAQKIASSFGKVVDSSTTMLQVLQDLATDIPIDKIVTELEQLGINVHAIKDQMSKVGNNSLFKEALVQIIRGNSIETPRAVLEKKAMDILAA